MEETPAIEDLMKEHGILNRILLIYEAIKTNIIANIHVDLSLLYHSALIIRFFIEDYHEKLEEKYIFPIFIENNHNTELIIELINQRNLGRVLTNNILKLSSLASIKDPSSISQNIMLFVDMYRIHEAREDTVVFPEFKKMITKKYYDELTEKFESTEKELFGENGYEKILHIVESIEKQLGIYDISNISKRIKNEKIIQ
jgi:hemerythrin-like domain-containing protein